MSANPQLTPHQVQILRRMAAEPGEGALKPTWIAEACGHWREPSWASTRLRSLAKRGFVQNLSPGWYVITDAGRAALPKDPDQ